MRGQTLASQRKTFDWDEKGMLINCPSTSLGEKVIPEIVHLQR